MRVIKKQGIASLTKFMYLHPLRRYHKISVGSRYKLLQQRTRLPRYVSGAIGSQQPQNEAANRCNDDWLFEKKNWFCPVQEFE